MTPPEMTDEQIALAWSQSKGDILLRLKPFAKAIISARDKQWVELREADEALMREVYESMQGAGWKDAYINAKNKLRARLGGV